MPHRRKRIIISLVLAGFSPAMANRIAIDAERGDELARIEIEAAS